MHVLITGGAGFIGSHTAERLLELGARVRVLDNLSSGKIANLPQSEARLDIRQGDVRDAQAVEQAMDGVSHVLHLAAQVSVAASLADPVGSGATNVGGFLQVLDCARRRSVRRFVYASSSAVYGTVAEALTTESTPARPISPYGLEKKIDDMYAALYRQVYGTSCAGLRYFNVFGTRQDASSPYSGVISLFMRALREGEPLGIYGDGQQTRDFIDVRDVARANARALDASFEGVCNVCCGKRTSLLELTRILGQVSGRPVSVRALGERAGDIRHSCGDNTRLRTELGISSFTSIEAGLRRLWNDAGTSTKTKESS
jgi:UDP-glucose 4-epimerase